MQNLPPEEITKDMRTAGKVCNFALLYGAGPATLQKHAVAKFGLDWSKDQSKAYVDMFRKAYPELKKWQDIQGNSTTESVLTKYGRRRFLFGMNDKYTTRLNTPVQGSSGDIAKIAVVMLEQHMENDKSGKLICVCHDEIVVESTPETAEFWAETVVKCMEDAGNLVCKKVPIKAEVAIGDDWSIK
jgi:DNA polymerase I-like protein with 3'-5' exonuclease and polymerase domains